MQAPKSPSETGLRVHFAALIDPRIDRSKRHELSDMLVIAICAVICGAESWTEIEDFGQAKLSWFQTFLELPHGIASHDTFGRVFSRIDPTQFHECFLSWITALSASSKGQIVAIDGKTLRRSFQKAAGKAAIQMVSAWAGANNLTLGQLKVEAKSNEQTAIPRLLELLDLKGSTVTIDAIGTLQPIARKIRSKEANYVLALKANQQILYEDTVAYFQRCLERNFRGMRHSSHQTVEKNHGRIESRQCWAIAPSKHIREWENWPDLRSVVLVESRRQIGESISSERRYFISSLEPDAEILLQAVRSHWGIENSVHWVLDVAFNEDQCRIRTGHAAENFALLRRLALNLLKNAPHKRGIKTRQKRAGWDHDFLLKTLTL
jgi:predicted transposase YbfD/YdcC